MYDPAYFHMMGLSNLENSVGYSSDIGRDYAANLMGEEIDRYDLIHLHGIPQLDRLELLFNIIKKCLINNKPFVLSTHSYAAMCYEMTLECGYKDCTNSNCTTIREVMSNLSDIPIFVYSKHAEELHKRAGFTNVTKMPICFYGAIDTYIRPEFNDNIIKRVSHFNVDSCFFKDEQIIRSFKKEHTELMYYPVGYMEAFETNFSLVPYTWNTAFPYEIGRSLRFGAPCITNNERILEEYPDFTEEILLFDLDTTTGRDLAASKMLSKMSYDKRCEIAFRFWKKYGTEICISWFTTFYRKCIDDYANH